MVPVTISLPDPLRDFVQARVDSGRYASVSDDARDLISRDQGGTAGEAHWHAT